MGFFGKKNDKAPIITYLDDYSQEKSEEKAAECSSVIPIPPETAVTESEVVEIVDGKTPTSFLPTRTMPTRTQTVRPFPSFDASE